MTIKNEIRSLQYNVVLVLECSHQELSISQLYQKFVSYPHFIIYYLEAVLLKKDLSVTSDLTTNSSILLQDQDPEWIIEEFVAELVRRQKPGAKTHL